MTNEEQRYVERELASINDGGCRHEIFVVDHIVGLGNPNLFRIDPPVIGLANEDDGFYIQYFKDREEIEKFIAELRSVADEAWGTHD